MGLSGYTSLDKTCADNHTVTGAVFQQPFLTDLTPGTWREAMALLHLTTFNYS